MNAVPMGRGEPLPLVWLGLELPPAGWLGALEFCQLNSLQEPSAWAHTWPLLMGRVGYFPELGAAQTGLRVGDKVSGTTVVLLTY